MGWTEIETDTRYMEDADLMYALAVANGSGAWPPARNIFERRLARNLREHTDVSLDLDAFIRVIGRSALEKGSCVTLDVSLQGGRVYGRVVAIERDVMPPITADVAGGLAFAMRWYGARESAFRVTLSPQNIFWIPACCKRLRT